MHCVSPATHSRIPLIQDKVDRNMEHSTAPSTWGLKESEPEGFPTFSESSLPPVQENPSPAFLHEHHLNHLQSGHAQARSPLRQLPLQHHVIIWSQITLPSQSFAQPAHFFLEVPEASFSIVAEPAFHPPSVLSSWSFDFLAEPAPGPWQDSDSLHHQFLQSLGSSLLRLTFATPPLHLHCPATFRIYPLLSSSRLVKFSCLFIFAASSSRSRPERGRGEGRGVLNFSFNHSTSTPCAPRISESSPSHEGGSWGVMHTTTITGASETVLLPRDLDGGNQGGATLWGKKGKPSLWIHRHQPPLQVYHCYDHHLQTGSCASWGQPEGTELAPYQWVQHWRGSTVGLGG